MYFKLKNLFVSFIVLSFCSCASRVEDLSFNNKKNINLNHGTVGLMVKMNSNIGQTTRGNVERYLHGNCSDISSTELSVLMCKAIQGFKKNFPLAEITSYKTADNKILINIPVEKDSSLRQINSFLNLISLTVIPKVSSQSYSLYLINKKSKRVLISSKQKTTYTFILLVFAMPFLDQPIDSIEQISNEFVKDLKRISEK